MRRLIIPTIVIALLCVVSPSAMPAGATQPAPHGLDRTFDQIVEGMSFHVTPGVGGWVCTRGLVVLRVNGKKEAVTDIWFSFGVPPDSKREALESCGAATMLMMNSCPGWEGAADFYIASAPLVRDYKAESITAKVKGKLITISCDRKLELYTIVIKPEPRP